MAERIDACSHVTTHKTNEALRDANPSFGTPPTPPMLLLENVDERVDRLDELDVDRQVINFSEQRAFLDCDPADMLEATRIANDEVRRYADAYPDRFIPTATLPFLTGEYVDEFERCINELDMAGVQIFSNVNGTFLDAPEFDEFYAAANDADVPIWIHPQNYEWHDFDDPENFWMYSCFGWPFETSIAVCRLVFNGVLDRYENLEIITHHLGGTIPYLDERLRSWVKTRQEEDPDSWRTGVERLQSLSQPIDAYFDRIYADTAVSSLGETETLECGNEFFGADNVLFGADVAYGPGDGFVWMEHMIPAIDDMDASAAAKEKIFAGNIKRLLGL